MTSTNGWRVGSFAGAAIIVDPTILLLAAYILGTSALEGGGAGLLASSVFFVALLTAVLLHEFGHAGVAAALRIPSKRIVLTLFGGYVEFAMTPKVRWHEIAVSAAGPLVNITTYLLLWWGAALTFGWPREAAAYIDNLAYISLLLGLFNLLPGYPLDGGTILQKLLSYGMNPIAARRVTAWTGLLIALALVAYATIAQLWWSLLIGLLLAFTAWGEIRRINAALKAQRADGATSNA